MHSPTLASVEYYNGTDGDTSHTVPDTSVLVSEYSFTLSTATMLFSRSEDIRTIQFRDMVTYKVVDKRLK